MITAASAVASLLVIVWKVAPRGYLGSPWLLVGAVLFELGLRKLPEHFRWLSYFVFGGGLLEICSRITWWTPTSAHHSQKPSHRHPLVVCLGERPDFRPMPDRIGDWEREWCRDLYTARELFAHDTGLAEMPPQVVALVWTVRPGAIRNRSSLRNAALSLVDALNCRRRLCSIICFRLRRIRRCVQITYRTFTILPILASRY